MALVKKFVVGNRPRLIEEGMQIKIRLIHKVSDIPDMLWVSFKKETSDKLRGEDLKYIRRRFH